MNNSLINVYIQHNTAGKTFEELEKDMSRDFYMTAEQSIEYGLADRVICSRE